MDLRETLAHTELLKDADGETIEQMLNSVGVQIAKKGEAIFDEGDASDSFYIINKKSFWPKLKS